MTFFIVYSIIVIMFILFVFIVFDFVRRDYIIHKQLTTFSASLQGLLFFAHSLIFCYVYWNSDWPELKSSSISIVAGTICALTGLTMLGAALITYNSLGRMLGLKVDELKCTGIYRLSRNPQLIGYGLILVSVPLLWNSWYAFATVILYLVVIYRMITVEEEHLRDVFGEEYKRYFARTSRFFGFPSSGH